MIFTLTLWQNVGIWIKNNHVGIWTVDHIKFGLLIIFLILQIFDDSWLTFGQQIQLILTSTFHIYLHHSNL